MGKGSMGVGVGIGEMGKGNMGKGVGKGERGKGDMGEGGWVWVWVWCGGDARTWGGNVGKEAWGRWGVSQSNNSGTTNWIA